MGHTQRRRRLTLTLAILGLLLLGCAFGGYRFLDSLDWWAPYVDPVALDARVRAELPPGSTAEQILAWMRANGIAEEHIRLLVHAREGVPTTNIYKVEGWYPQRHVGPYQPNRIVVWCLFDRDDRAEECRANRGYGDIQGLPGGGGSLVIVTPPPR
jgi:hypothetical protein